MAVAAVIQAVAATQVVIRAEAIQAADTQSVIQVVGTAPQAVTILVVTLTSDM